MTNNAAERALRCIAVGRNNFGDLTLSAAPLDSLEWKSMASCVLPSKWP